MARRALVAIALLVAQLQHCWSSITTIEAIKLITQNVTMDTPIASIGYREPRKENHPEELVEYFLSTLDQSESNEPEQIMRTAMLTHLIKKPEFKCFVGALFKRIPELPRIVRGIWKFLSDKNSVALREAFNQFLPPFLADAGKTLGKIQNVLADDRDIYVWQALKLWIFLQKPEVLEVIQKFQMLNEVLLVAELSKHCGINVMHTLHDFETNLVNPLYI